MKILIPAVLLVSFWIVLLVILLTPAPPDSTGFAHPRHAAMTDGATAPAMNQGGEGRQRHGRILWAGWLLAALMAVMLTGILLFGVQSTGLSKGKALAFALGGIAYQVVFAMLFLAYRNSLTGPVVFIGSFPAATWWVLFGVYLLPYYFILLYVALFDRWVVTPDSLRKFDELLSEHRSHQEEGD